MNPRRFLADEAEQGLLAVVHPAIAFDPSVFLKPGDHYCLKNPRDYFGQPVRSGRLEGPPIRIRLAGEFTAFVLWRTYKQW